VPTVLVLMPYTREWSEQVWQALSRVQQVDTSKTISLHRVDTESVAADGLAEHIESNIKGADIVLADLTEANPNVHIEVGFALALKKPLLLVTQDRKWVTTHLQGRIVEEYSCKGADGLGRLTSTMLFRIKDKMEMLRAKNDEAIARASSAIEYSVECYSHRASVGLERYFREARHRIDILTTNLSFLFEPYADAPLTYFDELSAALDRVDSKTKVRILTLDPESDFAAKRGIQIGFAPAVFRDQLRAALAATKQVGAKYSSDRFEVRTYGDFPNQITYRIDDHIFNCVVAQPTQSRKHLTFKLTRHQSGVDNSFINHFLNVWGGRAGSAAA